MATGYTAHGPAGRTSSRLRTAIGLGALAEVVVFVLVAAWIGVGWTDPGDPGHQRARLGCCWPGRAPRR